MTSKEVDCKPDLVLFLLEKGRWIAMIGKVLIWLMIGIIYFLSFCLMRCASLADQDYEILARKKFMEDTMTECTDVKSKSERCVE